MNKWIFLDFDGVLNSNQYFKSLNKKSIYQPNINKMFDPEAINLLNILIEKTGANVVISSSWKFGHSLDELNNLLNLVGAKFRAIDTTPNIGHRAEEIQTYLNNHQDIVDFIIIDDLLDMGHFTNSDRLIKTCWEFGFTKWHLEKALIALKGETMKCQIKDLKFQMIENQHAADIIQYLKDNGYTIVGVSDISNDELPFVKQTKIEYIKDI